MLAWVQLFESVSSRQEGPTLVTLTNAATALHTKATTPSQAGLPPAGSKPSADANAPADPQDDVVPPVGATDSTGDPSSSILPPTTPPPKPKK